MVLDPIPQSLPVHYFGSRPQPPTSPQDKVRLNYNLILNLYHKIPRNLSFSIWICTTRYQGTWVMVFRFGGYRGCGIFSEKLSYKISWCSLWGGFGHSRIDKIIGLFCKKALLKRRYSAKETCNLIDPTTCSHPVFTHESWRILTHSRVTDSQTTHAHVWLLDIWLIHAWLIYKRLIQMWLIPKWLVHMWLVCKKLIHVWLVHKWSIHAWLICKWLISHVTHVQTTHSHVTRSQTTLKKSHYTPMSHKWSCMNDLVCVTCLIHMCDMTHSCVCHDSSICVPCITAHAWIPITSLNHVIQATSRVSVDTETRTPSLRQALIRTRTRTHAHTHVETHIHTHAFRPSLRYAPI